MADRRARRSQNVDGELFVDESCIDCDTCRWMAPGVYDRVDGKSRVHRQPADEAERDLALAALLSCPTASIGSEASFDARAAAALLPLPVDGPVHHCGYHHEASFGAASYLLQRPEGNVLVDSPRFNRPLVEQLERLGGVATMFLTHIDDVADHEKFVGHFGCERVMHADDLGGACPEVEHPVEGSEPVALADDLLVVPVPGHTRGSACLLASDTWLFTGDHLAWSRSLGHLYAFASACWYDWDVQRASMERLLEHRFSWVLPGHGTRAHLEPDAMADGLRHCVAWMATAR